MSDKRTRYHLVSWLTTAIFTFMVSGCGTIISGTRQNLKLAMEPPGAQLDVFRWSGEHLAGPAVTPGKLSVHRPVRGESYLVRASKEGYCPKYWVTSSRASGGAWTYLWMLFIPALGPILIGATAALIDSATGGCCAASPDVFSASLEPEHLCAR